MPDPPPVLTRRAWEDAAQPLYDWLRKIHFAWADGIPPGFNENIPETVEAGDTGDDGTETSGWAASDHEHPVSTGTPGIIGTANDEGTGTSLARSDHTHQKLPREFLLMGG